MSVEIAFIGGGNMTEAMGAALLRAQISLPENVRVSDIKAERRQYMAQKYGVKTTGNNREAINGADLVILATKPQDIDAVMAGLNGELRAEQLVLSIIAGVPIVKLERGLGHGRLVRVMPNTPAQVGQGMSVWTATPAVSAEQKALAASLLKAMGKEIMVGDEDIIDRATAVSGSGPAYLFLFVESLAGAAESLGFAPEVASELVMQTVLGASCFLAESGKTPAELRKMVTSPGGTTAAALAVFEKGQFAALVKDAVAAAYRRARELGK
ncbi:MAG: pyrroline-5-carboxylate reductase [Dehalococcoidia bacterium]|nr:MAG: pyrroline-5-carboxylate reductase [Dehalococcoidia bacterium]